MRSRVPLIALAAAAVLPSAASAVDFSVNGFSTAAYAQTDTDEAQVGYSGQPDGIDSDGSFEIDSKLGLQVAAKFNEMVSATVQAVAYADLTGDWEPRLDWAYVRVQPLSSVSVRAGYLRAPTFMFSDSVFVGYANTWVRPPMEVYNMSAVYQMRGVDVTWRGSLGPLAVSISPYYGDGEVDLETETLDVPEWQGLVASVEYNSFMARVGYSEVELGSTTKALVPFLDVLRSLPASVCGACASEADRLDLDGPVVKNFDVGVRYDDGDNLFLAEYATSRSGGHYLVSAKDGAYATYGRRFGALMPYATYAISRREEVTESNAIQIPALAAVVNASLASGYTDQDSYSVGLRYDVPAFSIVNGALLKLQFDHIDAKDGVGMMNNVQPGFDGSVNMFTVSFDFIF